MIEQACTMKCDAPQPVEYQYDRTILLLADSAGVRERMRRAARRAGYRVSGAASLAEAGERLDRQVAVNAVAVQLDERARGGLEPLLARLDAGAREGRHASIVAGPEAMIDELAAGLCHRDIYHLCEPDRADWLDALAAAAAPGPLRLSDINKESGGPR